MPTPMIFTPNMMKGIISGEKTQTCRKPGPSITGIQKYGDTIWVRENFYEKGRWNPNSGPDDVDWEDANWSSLKEVLYAVDCDKPTSKPPEYWWRSRPSIHMPQWASRYTLSVRQLCQKPVQSLTLDEINREGIGIFTSYEPAYKAWENLWVSLYGRYSWLSNPELVVIGFKVLESKKTSNIISTRMVGA
ncbi:hypothetical protein D1615_20935 [Klebsiella pneumoniae]|uniref:hypothetical protein n=1 Tax=Klebsiella pneumoniae TaxID=573 RepID=UPI000E685114|nr:hypothetical protein [Klebsiella pneumoniae]RIU55278.1 hypothetical protein D1615_20935 [Klebsiella pneumoniae]